MPTSYSEMMTDTETVAANNHPHKASCLQAFILNKPKANASLNRKLSSAYEQEGDPPVPSPSGRDD